MKVESIHRQSGKVGGIIFEGVLIYPLGFDERFAGAQISDFGKAVAIGIQYGDGGGQFFKLTYPEVTEKGVLESITHHITLVFTGIEARK